MFLRSLLVLALGIGLIAQPVLAARYDLSTQQLRHRARKIVVSAVHQPDTFVQSLAIRAFDDLEDRTSFPVLRLALLSIDRAVRYLAFRTLYRLHDPAAGAALNLGMRSAQATARVQTVWMIGEMGDLFRRQQDRRALDWLVQAVQDPDDDVRTTAYEALGKLADPQGTRVAIPGCRDRAAEARQYAVETIGKLGQPAQFTLVLGMLRDNDPAVRRQAAIALSRLAARGVPTDRDAAIAGLRRLLTDSDPGVRAQGAVGLLQLDTVDAQRPLDFLFAEKDTAVRLAAIDALESLPGAAAVPVWRLALQDRVNEVRLRAALLLARKGDPAGSTILKAALMDPDWAIRLQAAEALADLGNTAALRRALQDPRMETRLAALKAVAQRPSRAAPDREEFMDLLLQRLDDTQPPMRARAAEALGLLRDRTSLPRLAALLDDQHQMVRTAAAWAVLRITK